MTADPLRAEADWLDLRRAADEEARDRGAAELLDALADWLAADGARALQVVDVGAGTGANGRYLKPRLPWPQEWVVVDHDAEHLRHPAHDGAVRIEATMRELLGVLEDLPVPHGAVRLVTCAALLDVLAEEELAGLARLVVNAEGPALLSLSVDGRVAWSPPDPADDLVAQAFDRHQRRDGRAGPDAPRLFEGLLAGLLAGDTTARCRLLRAEVDWLLGPERPELLRRWLDERVQAVLDQWLVDPLDDQAGDRIDTDPGEPPDRRGQRDPDGPFAEPVAPVVLGWHERRLEQMAEGRLRVRVGHVDLLVLLRRG